MPLSPSYFPNPSAKIPFEAYPCVECRVKKPCPLCLQYRLMDLMERVVEHGVKVCQARAAHE